MNIKEYTELTDIPIDEEEIMLRLTHVYPLLYFLKNDSNNGELREQLNYLLRNIINLSKTLKIELEQFDFMEDKNPLSLASILIYYSGGAILDYYQSNKSMNSTEVKEFYSYLLMLFRKLNIEINL